MCYKSFVIIGLTGRNGSGKGVVADYLQSKGFGFWSLSDVIRDEVARRGEEVTRPRLIRAGRELRAEYGSDHLAQEILAKLEADRNYVVDSFRHPAEVRAFSRQPDFYLVAVEAEAEVRHQRVCARGRENDPVSFERFLELERQELSSPDTQGQQLLATGRLANVSFANNGTRQDLRSKVAEWVKRTAPKMTRPGWDPYFMKLAQVVALRSNCIKRKVGAIIVRDLRVISTGYNGTPRGTRNCFEGGCPRCGGLADSGTQLGDCLCSHAEENAITQAAYHGVSVNGGVLYTTYSPCLTCSKMIINSGVVEVVYNLEYPLSGRSFRLLREASVVCRRLTVGESAALPAVSEMRSSK